MSKGVGPVVLVDSLDVDLELYRDRLNIFSCLKKASHKQCSDKSSHCKLRVVSMATLRPLNSPSLISSLEHFWFNPGTQMGIQELNSNFEKCFTNYDQYYISERFALDHPVACIHAISAQCPNALEMLIDSVKTFNERFEPIREGLCSRDILHFFLIVRGSTEVDSGLFEMMQSRFGHNSCQLIFHADRSFDKEITLWEDFLANFYQNSLSPFLKNFISSTPLLSTNTFGISKLISASKKMFGGEDHGTIDPEEFANWRRVIEFTVFLGDNQLLESAIRSCQIVSDDLSVFFYPYKCFLQEANPALYKESVKFLMPRQINFTQVFDALSFLQKSTNQSYMEEFVAELVNHNLESLPWPLVAYLQLKASSYFKTTKLRRKMLFCLYKAVLGAYLLISECQSISGFPSSFGDISNSFLSIKIPHHGYTGDFLQACCQTGGADAHRLLFEMFPDTITFPVISVGNESSLISERHGVIKCPHIAGFSGALNDLCSEYRPTIFEGERLRLQLTLKNNLRIPLIISVHGVIFETIEESKTRCQALTDGQTSIEIMPLCEGSMICRLEIDFTGPTNMTLDSIIFTVNNRKYLLENMLLPLSLAQVKLHLSHAKRPRISVNLVEFRSCLDRPDAIALISVCNTGNSVAEDVAIIFESRTYNLPPLGPEQCTNLSLPFVKGNQLLNIAVVSRSLNGVIGLESIPHSPPYRIDMSSILVRYGSIIIFKVISTSQVVCIQSGSCTYDISQNQNVCIYNPTLSGEQIVVRSSSHIERVCSRLTDLH